MRLYDTERRAVVPFTPGRVVGMYTCGITPYDATHLGHAATYVTYDVLQRRLRDRGHETRCVRNITDVDDDDDNDNDQFFATNFMHKRSN